METHALENPPKKPDQKEKRRIDDAKIFKQAKRTALQALGVLGIVGTIGCAGINNNKKPTGYVLGGVTVAAQEKKASGMVKGSVKLPGIVGKPPKPESPENLESSENPESPPQTENPEFIAPSFQSITTFTNKADTKKESISQTFQIIGGIAYPNESGTNIELLGSLGMTHTVSNLRKNPTYGANVYTAVSVNPTIAIPIRPGKDNEVDILPYVGAQFTYDPKDNGKDPWVIDPNAGLGVSLVSKRFELGAGANVTVTRQGGKWGDFGSNENFYMKVPF